MREAGIKEKGRAKIARIPIKIAPREPLAKPAWIRVRAPGPNSRFHAIKNILREQKLHTVCEEASCPNIAECFGKGTATFMILGDLCTRRCPFCDVAHGRPLAPDAEEPRHLAETISRLNLSYVVITSVDRDDLRDGGAQHFVDCIRAVRALSPQTRIEVLVPDFRGRLQRALELLCAAPPDVMNHNLETVPRLYRQALAIAEQSGLDMKLVLEAVETGIAASPQVLRHSKRMVARNFSGATFTAALRHKDAAYAVALAEILLSDPPMMGRAAVQAYERAKAYAPDDDEGKMIELVSRAKGAT